MLLRMNCDVTYTGQLRLARPARAESVRELRLAAVAFARAWGVECPDDVGLAVSEAATNSVVHAYPAEVEGPILLAIDLDGDTCLVSVSDEGVGLRPRPDSPGMGLGLPLMAQLSEGLDITDGRTGGVHIKMAFRRRLAA
jgi:serine/threonine-protein kinase RsbW